MKILIIGGKHRHKYAVANRMVEYATKVLGKSVPFHLISDPNHYVPESCICILKSEYTTVDVLDPKKMVFDLIVRLPTDPKELEYQYSLETSLSAKHKPITEFAENCVNIVIENQGKITNKDLWDFAAETEQQPPLPSWASVRLEPIPRKVTRVENGENLQGTEKQPPRRVF
jgi:hypothetical protein